MKKVLLIESNNCHYGKIQEEVENKLQIIVSKNHLVKNRTMSPLRKQPICTKRVILDGIFIF